MELRRAEGYMAECYPVESVEVGICDRAGLSERFVLMEHNCAISNVAETFPSVCGNELEMFAALLPDCIVERTHWIINGEHRCGYLIARRKEEGSSATDSVTDVTDVTDVRKKEVRQRIL
jgi:DeoR family suf operon transcriptional repressor